MTARRPTVLIVEDEELVREIAALEFEDAGFEVLQAATGDTAMTLITGTREIDLLFTDIRLPGSIDGWSIAERARELRPELPVFYATGYSDTPRLVAGARFFRKPYLPTAIVSAAQSMGIAGRPD